MKIVIEIKRIEKHPGTITTVALYPPTTEATP